MKHIPWIDQGFLARKSIFYVGGSYAGKDGQHFMSNQMYVEAYEPSELLHPYPVIMFHGAGQTNVNWLITPDGRMGWADYFVSKGYRVFLAEQPARGRSAWHPAVNGPTTFHPVEILENRFTTDQGPWLRAKTHTQWPDNGSDWEDESFRQFVSSQVEYLPRNKESQKLVLEAGKELLALTGPAILLTHSQAGPFGWLLADACPELVKAILALEPFGPPFSNDVSDPTAKNFGLADLPMHFEPPVERPEDIQLELLPASEAWQKDGWVMKEPARKLPRLMGIPTAILVGESSYHTQYDHLTSYVLRQAGVEHDYVPLETVGIRGNSHMMMLEKNSREIADWMLGWLRKKNL